MSQGRIDVDSLEAIDVHTHVQRSVTGRTFEPGSPEYAVGAVFGSDRLLTVHELADFYRERRMAAVVFMVDTKQWQQPVTNDELFELAAEHSDVIIPFASIDPARGADGVAEARRLIDEYDVRGFKFHPSLQGFYPNDRAHYPLYEVIEQARVPALFHTGQTAVGSGERGGGGILLKYANPLYLDDVAANFPDMPIIMAHPSVPWQDEQLSIAVHKPNVYIDLSGWSPKYFAPSLVQYSRTLLKRKVMFGTDFPGLTPERWLADFEGLDFSAEVRSLILKGNAARLLGLSDAEAPEPGR
jgi:uncharacterized protein